MKHDGFLSSLLSVHKLFGYYHFLFFVIFVLPANTLFVFQACYTGTTTGMSLMCTVRLVSPCSVQLFGLSGSCNSPNFAGFYFKNFNIFILDEYACPYILSHLAYLLCAYVHILS